jgi:hypothetical protein
MLKNRPHKRLQFWYIRILCALYMARPPASLSCTISEALRSPLDSLQNVLYVRGEMVMRLQTILFVLGCFLLCGVALGSLGESAKMRTPVWLRVPDTIRDEGILWTGPLKPGQPKKTPPIPGFIGGGRIGHCQLVDQPIQALPGVAYSVYENRHASQLIQASSFPCGDY